MRRLIWPSMIVVLVLGTLLLVRILPSAAWLPIFPTPTMAATPGPFEPAHYGVPDVIAGHRVLAVISAENTMCVPPHFLTLIVRAEAPDPQTYTNSAEAQDLNTAIRQFDHPGWDLTLNVIGPEMSLDNSEANTAQWNQQMKASGCIKLGGPIPVPEDTATLSP